MPDGPFGQMAPPQPPGHRRRADWLPWSGNGGGATPLPRPEATAPALFVSGPLAGRAEGGRGDSLSLIHI
eukprot:3574109-Pyramimonas_sp.AAC.1